MPAGNLAAAPLIGWIQSLPCRARAPEGWLDDANARRRAAAAYDDARRFPRFFCRGQAARAALEYQQSLPALPRKKGWHGVNLVDLSRGGWKLPAPRAAVSRRADADDPDDQLAAGHGSRLVPPAASRLLLCRREVHRGGGRRSRKSG